MKNSNTVMIQVDFAENYTCAAQDEVQSAHQKQNQITLFTSGLWFRENTQCQVIISDHLKHEKTPIIVFMDELFSKKPVDATTVKVGSDRPRNHFKNKYVMGSFDKRSRKHKVHMIQNFTATSHRKGPVDREWGATVKREAGQKIHTRRQSIKNLDDFGKTCKPLKNLNYKNLIRSF